MEVQRVTNYKKGNFNINERIEGYLSNGTKFEELNTTGNNDIKYKIKNKEEKFEHQYQSYQRPSFLCFANNKYFWVDYCILRLNNSYISGNDWELLKYHGTENNDTVQFQDCKSGTIEIVTIEQYCVETKNDRRKVTQIKINDTNNNTSSIEISDNIFVMLLSMDKTYLIALENSMYKSENYQELLNQIEVNILNTNRMDLNIVYKTGPNEREIIIYKHSNVSQSGVSQSGDLVNLINSLNPLYQLSEDKTYAYWIITVSDLYEGILEVDSDIYNFKMIFTPFGLLMLGENNDEYKNLIQKCLSFIGRENDSFITSNEYKIDKETKSGNKKTESVSMLASLLTEQIYFDMITDTNEDSRSALVGFKFLSFLTVYDAKDSSKSKRILNFESKLSNNQQTTYMKETGLDENIILEYTKYQDQFKLVEVE